MELGHWGSHLGQKKIHISSFKINLRKPKIPLSYKKYQSINVRESNHFYNFITWKTFM